jgi:hypothetical protein
MKEFFLKQTKLQTKDLLNQETEIPSNERGETKLIRTEAKGFCFKPGTRQYCIRI